MVNHQCVCVCGGRVGYRGAGQRPNGWEGGGAPSSFGHLSCPLPGFQSVWLGYMLGKCYPPPPALSHWHMRGKEELPHPLTHWASVLPPVTPLPPLHAHNTLVVDHYNLTQTQPQFMGMHCTVQMHYREKGLLIAPATLQCVTTVCNRNYVHTCRGYFEAVTHHGDQY